MFGSLSAPAYGAQTAFLDLHLVAFLNHPLFKLKATELRIQVAHGTIYYDKIWNQFS